MFDLLASGIVTTLQWKYMVPLFLGTLVGVVGGSLPGVTITMTVIVILPFTYGLDPLAGLAAMTGVYVGGSTGGLIHRRRRRTPGWGSRRASGSARR